MSKSLKLVVPGLVLIVLAAMLNPGPERHREKIKSQLSERSPLAKMLLVGPITAFAANYHSHGLYSYTKLDDELISIGAFGVVVVID